jgi:hypothetical protein
MRVWLAAGSGKRMGAGGESSEPLKANNTTLPAPYEPCRSRCPSLDRLWRRVDAAASGLGVALYPRPVSIDRAARAPHFSPRRLAGCRDTSIS